MSFVFNSPDAIHRVAVTVDSGDCVTYGQLAKLSSQATDAFKPDDLVAIECDNSLDSLLAYVGCMQKGVPALLVEKGLDDSKKAQLYQHYRVSLVNSGGVSQRLLPCGPAMHPDLALLLSTSGSTGSPKLVRLSRFNINSNARQIATYLGLDHQSRAITTLPLQYSFGLSIINSHFFVSGSIALTDKSITERGFWDFFHLAKPDSFSGVPATYEMLRRIRFERMSLPSLKTMTQAGGRLSAESIEYFANLGLNKGYEFWVMYGQTEATARMSYLPSSQSLSKSDSIGIPIPDGRFEIIDSDGYRIDCAAQVGELVYYGPNVMMGYATDATDLARGDTQNGRLCTGDLAEFDVDGYFYIRGRLKRFLKLFGNRINLDEVEKDLQKEGLNVYVSGKDDQLLIVGTDNNEVERASIDFCSRFRFHPSAVKVMVLEQIPRNDSGKIQYAKILDLFESKVSTS